MTLLKKYHPEGFIKQKYQYIVLQVKSLFFLQEILSPQRREVRKEKH